MKKLALILIGSFAMASCSGQSSTEESSQTKTYPYDISDAEWKEKLSEDEYQILRKQGTERAFTSDLLDNKKEGVYTCAGCGEFLFESDTKFKSGTGWPSFHTAIKGQVAETEDNKYGMSRTEILCANCGGHLGHVFPDGPKPTGLRYCVNGLALDFREE